MGNVAKYKIVLSSVGKDFANNHKDAAWFIAQTFHVKIGEVQRIIDRAPIVLFDNLSTEDIKSMQSAVVFLSKMGIDVSITTQVQSSFSYTNWRYTSSPSAITCPCCGEPFLLVHAKSSTPTANEGISGRRPAMNEGISGRRATVEATMSEFEEIDGLSAELESIANEDSDSSIEEIEEIGSVSQEIEEIGSFSEELEKIGDITEELEELTNSNFGRRNNNISEIEDIEGISAEFEEIEGVSAEFERICMDDMEDIGSLSAELEEIEGISAEFEKITDESIERLDTNTVGDFALRGVDKSENDMEDIEAISAELEKIADPVDDREFVDAHDNNEESFTQLFLNKNNITHNSAPPVKPVSRASLTIKNGPYNVIISINKQGNIALANKTISKLLQIPIERVAEHTSVQPSVTVAKKVSKETAQAIVQQFQKYKMSGHITINK